jgi:hypothetical protein
MLPQSNRVLLCGALLAALFRHIIHLQPHHAVSDAAEISEVTSVPMRTIICTSKDVSKAVCSCWEPSICMQVVSQTNPSLRVGCAPCFSAGHQAAIRPCPAHNSHMGLALHHLVAAICLAGNPLPSKLSGMHMYLPGYPSPPYPHCSRRCTRATYRSLACSEPATQRNDVCCPHATRGPT